MKVLLINGSPHKEGCTFTALTEIKERLATHDVDSEKYFTISNMTVVSSSYWNSVHGNTPEEVKQDLEGLHTMRTLADNMAWLLKSIENNDLPKTDEKIFTNFIR